MSLNQILDTALTGLAAAQANLRSTAVNIANVNTPGYARERSTQTTAVSNGRGTGVAVGQSSRIADRYLENTVYARAGAAERNAVVASFTDRMQGLLGRPGDRFGLPGRISAVMASAAAMTGLSAPVEAVATFVGTADDAIGTLRDVQGEVAALRSEAAASATTTVDRINVLLRQVDVLNREVATVSNANGAANRRLTALQELGGLIDVTIRDQPDGRVSIETKTGVVLLDQRVRQLDSAAGAVTGSYPAITVRLMAADGGAGAATGEVIDSAAVGGRLGGLIDVRDRTIPTMTRELGSVFAGLSEALNAASNTGTTLPAPTRLTGRSTGLIASDRLGFTGSTTFAVVTGTGKLAARTTIDFTALGPAATVQDGLDAINAGLGGAATASLVDGKLVIAATAAANGVAIGQAPPTPASRAGMGFSQFFGLNDLVRSDSGTMAPIGLAATDPHGFGPGESAGLELRDAGGKLIANYALTGRAGGTVGDLVTELNASPLAAGGGQFSLDPRGRIRFAPGIAMAGASIATVADSTSRFGTGVSFSQWSGLAPDDPALAGAMIDPDIAARPGTMPLAQLDTAAAIGADAIAAGDVRGATGFVDWLSAAIDLGRDGVFTVADLSTRMIGDIGTDAARALAASQEATGLFTDAVARRDNFAGVNVEEETALMIVFQNSYSAAARIVSVTSQMYDTLINMVD